MFPSILREKLEKKAGEALSLNPVVFDSTPLSFIELLDIGKALNEFPASLEGFQTATTRKLLSEVHNGISIKYKDPQGSRRPVIIHGPSHGDNVGAGLTGKTQVTGGGDGLTLYTTLQVGKSGNTPIVVDVRNIDTSDYEKGIQPSDLYSRKQVFEFADSDTKLQDIDPKTGKPVRARMGGKDNRGSNARTGTNKIIRRASTAIKIYKYIRRFIKFPGIRL